MQDGQQQVMHVHRLRMLNPRFQHGQLQNVAGSFVQNEFRRVDGFVDFFYSYPVFQFCFHGWKIDVQSCKHILYQAILFSEHPQKKMFRAN